MRKEEDFSPPPAEQTSAIFGEIALSLSGGGYRAAAFHLGVLDMLDRLHLLREARSISTISGGTIIGMFYAVNAAEGRDFNKFYDSLYGFLRKRNVVSEAFKFVSQKKKTDPQPSLIKAAANVYASKDFLSDRKLGCLLDATKSHLTEQVFNATDFLHGVSFRFLKSISNRALIGNSYSSIPRQVAREIRLADIVAASSCFPSVFEPLAFPDDFQWSSPLHEVRANLGKGFEKPIALMDGGIYDNQGVDSILQIYRRKGKKLGLFIFSDVDNKADELYQVGVPGEKGSLSLRTVVMLSWILFIIGFASLSWILAFAYVTYLGGNLSWITLLLMFGIPFLFTASVLIVMAQTRSKFKELAKFADETAGVNLWNFLKCLTVPELITLARSRVSSLVILSSTIFMKRVRDLTYYNLFTHPDYHGRLVPVLIYDLLDLPIVRSQAAPRVTGEHEKQMAEEPTAERITVEDMTGCSQKLHDVVDDARKYETNLWFFDDKNLSNLICCGQATVCLAVMRFLKEHRSEAFKNTDSQESRLKSLILGYWTSLNDSARPLERQDLSS